MINFNNLHKTYKIKSFKPVKALDGFSLEIKSNEVFALAGINGAGKTTALKALFGLIKLDEGSIDFNEGCSSSDLIGFAPEIPDLPDYMTVEEVLEFSCKLAGVTPTPALIGKSLMLFELEPLKNKIVSTLSKGNRQRLSLAAATVYEPKIIVYDEPTSGLDPLGRNLIKCVIKKLKADGCTIIFSTHMLADLPELCDKMAVVHCGKVVFAGRVSEFCAEKSLVMLEKRFAELVEPKA